MEDSKNTTPDAQEMQKRVNQYFWDRHLEQVTKDFAEGRLPEGLDRDLLLKRYAEYVKPYVEPYSDSASITDYGGAKICGVRTGYFAERLETFLNNTIADTDGFCRYVRFKWHRYIQQKLMNLIIRLIHTFAEMEESEIDGRNRHAVQIAKRLEQTLNKM